MTTTERILQFIDYKGISKYIFLKKTGLSNGFLDKKRAIGTDKCENILEVYPEISLEWLIMGRGNMVKQPADSTVNQSILGDNNMQVSNSKVKTDSVSNTQLLAEIKELKQQVAERDKIINNLIRQQEKLINKLTS